MNENSLEYIFTKTPETFCFRLLYWDMSSTPANIGWGVDAPQCKGLDFEILGTRSKRKKLFTVDAVYPVSQLPEMNQHSIVKLVRALREGARIATGLDVEGIFANIIDWE